MKLHITEEELFRVLEWATERLASGVTFEGYPYESGIIDALDWVFGQCEAPDKE